MNAQPTAQISIEQRMRTVRTLWLALLLSIGMYYVFTRFAGRAENVQPNDTMSLALLIAGVAAVLVSFVVKKKLVDQAIAQRQILNVQHGYLVAWVLGLCAFSVCSVG